MTRLHRSRLATLLLLAAACTSEESGIPPLTFSLPEEDYWPAPTESPGVGAGRILVTNNLDDTVSVIDLAALDDPSELARVPVGLNPVEREGPHHLAADAEGRFYYVGISNYVPGGGSGPHGAHGTGNADGYALKIDAATHLLVASERVDPNPGDIRLTPDGKRLLVSHYDLLRITQTLIDGGDPSEMDSHLAVIDPETMTRIAMVPLCPAAHGIAISPDSSRAYATCLDDRIAIVELDDPAFPVKHVNVLDSPGDVTAPICSPYALTVSPDGESVWVSCLESHAIARFDATTDTMDPEGGVLLAGPALFGAFRSDGMLLVPHQGIDGIAVIDPSDATVTNDVTFDPAACENVHVVQPAPDGERLLVVCEGDHEEPGTLLVLDAATLAVQNVVELGVFPDDVAVLVPEGGS